MAYRKLNDAVRVPSIRPSLNLDFANSKTLDPRVNFTRASTATYWDGKTTAKAEENLNTYSESLDTWSGWNASTAINVTTAPDGSTTADKVISTTTDVIQSRFKFYANGALSNTPTTYSVYLKAAGYDYGFFGLVMNSGRIDTGMVVSLTTGAITDTFEIATGARGTSTFSVQSVGDGWYRCIISCTNVTYSTNTGFSAGPSNSATPTYNIGVPRFLGDGSSGTYIWGAQVEERSSVTAYTPTTSAPITKYRPVIQLANTHRPRFDHDPVTGESRGVLIEEARTNLISDSTQLYSSSASNGLFANWTKASHSDQNVSIAPDGTNTAFRYVHHTPTANIMWRFNNTISSGAKYTISGWFKKDPGANNSTYLKVRFGAAWGNNGTLDSYNMTAQDIPLTDEWVRHSYTFVQPDGFNSMELGISTGGSPALTPYFACLVWGMQIEAGAFATSYIPTSGATATRAGDFLQLPISNFDYNYRESTAIISGQNNSDIDSYQLYYIGTNSSTYSRWAYSNFGHATVRNYSSTGTSLNRLVDSLEDTGNFSLASSVTESDSSLALNGGVNSGSGSSVDFRTRFTSFYIGSVSSGRQINGWVSDFTYYPKGLSVEELQELTGE